MTGGRAPTTFAKRPGDRSAMKVSLIQMNSINDKAANIAAAEALIERAVAK